MNKTVPEIAILSFSPVHRDARVLRQIRYLSAHFGITVVGYGHLPPGLPGEVRMTAVEPPTTFARRTRKLVLLPFGKVWPASVYPFWYWSEGEYLSAFNLLSQTRAEVIHANDWEALPVAARVAEETGKRVVLDLHEYAPLLRDNRTYWRMFYKPCTEYFLRKHIPSVSASVTVNQTLAERYAEEYRLHPIVVMNAPELPNKPPFRPTNPHQIRLVHHGAAIRSRKLELMVETLAHTDSRFSLHFMLLEKSHGYVSDLQALARRRAPNKVFFHAAPLPAQIVSTISQFDLGIYILPFTGYNHSIALPNKFFEFVAAGLAVCTGPSPEMASLTQRYQFGATAPSFDPIDVAALLNNLTASDIDGMKLRALEARELLNADVEMAKLIKLYEQLF
jgi:hypothetical protein